MRNSDLNEMRELETILIQTRQENQELREKWSNLLTVCCNAEDEARFAAQEIERLQNTIEDNYHSRTDLEIKTEQLTNQLHVTQGELRHVKLEHTNAAAKYESRIANLLSDVEYYKNNHQYALEHKKEQDKLIAEVKFVVEKLRDENKDLKAKQVNAEHLAKQVVKLQDELSKLEMTYCPYQKESRNGNTSHLPCGKCVKCKLDAAYGIIDRITTNVEQVEQDKEKLETEKDLVQEELNAANSELQRLKDASHRLQKTIAALEDSNQHYSDCLKQQLKVNVSLTATNESLRQIITIMKTGLTRIATPFTFFRKRRAKKILNLTATLECGMKDAKPSNHNEPRTN